MLPENAGVVDLVEYLAEFNSGLAKRTKDAKTAMALNAVASRASRVARRLGKVRRTEYRAWIADLSRRPKNDLIRRFSTLLGDERVYIIGKDLSEHTSTTEAFLRLLQRIVLDFANFTEQKPRGNHARNN